METTTLRAFHGDKNIKTKYVARVEAHAKADEIVQGYYWQNGKGCAVGCTIEGSDHSKYETQLGIPRIIARLEDRIFEGLTNGEAKEFPLKFLKAIKVGADLSLIWPKFAVWLLVDKKDGVIRFAKTDAQKKAITDVANLYKRVVNGELVDSKTWGDARHAAANAAANAADAAANAADADAANAAANAANAAANAADAAANAADADAAANAAANAARNSHYQKCARKLLSLLEEAPIKKQK